MLLHSVNSFRERLNNQILIRIPPSPYFPNRVRVYHRFDIFGDIPLLSPFVVKRDRMRRDTLKGVLEVDLGTTRHANMKTWEPQVGEVLHEVKGLFAKGWYSRSFGTLVGRIQDKINWA